MSAQTVGIDVCKANLEVGIWPSRDAFRVGNTAGGIKELIRAMKVVRPSLVVLEPSGGYEREVLRALHRASIPVALANPLRTKGFMQARNGVAKTDKADAMGLAHFADSIRPEPREPISDEDEEAKARAVRRGQLGEMIAAEKNRLRTAPKVVRREIKKHIGWLEDERDALDRQLRAEVADRPDWAEKAALLQSVKGVAGVVAYTLLTQLPELGRLDRRKIATLVGVAPINRDSGQHQGKRSTWGGRAEVRRVLFLAAMAAVRSEGPIQDFYQRLIAAGKEKMVALIASTRKLLTILNAMMRDGSSWDPNRSRRACGNVGAALVAQMP